MGSLTGRLEKEEAFYQKMNEKLKDLPSVMSEYYISMRANRKSYTTMNVYINNILHFMNSIGVHTTDNDFYTKITSADVERYIISLETRITKDGIKKTGDDALQARWSSLNHFFTWLVKRGYITDNPIIAVERPKNQTEHKVTYLTKTEVDKLYKAIDKNPDRTHSLRDRTLISLALSTALRVSAIVNINVEDIDFDNNVINVIEKRQKVRAIAFGDQTKQMLLDWIEVRQKEYADVETTALFVSKKKSRLSVDAVGELLTRYCNQAKIQRITPHKLRATAACALAKAGIPVKTIAKQLGHNNTQTTMRYIDAFTEDAEKAKNILDKMV